MDTVPLTTREQLATCFDENGRMNETAFFSLLAHINMVENAHNFMVEKLAKFDSDGLFFPTLPVSPVFPIFGGLGVCAHTTQT